MNFFLKGHNWQQEMKAKQITCEVLKVINNPSIVFPRIYLIEIEIKHLKNRYQKFTTRRRAKSLSADSGAVSSIWHHGWKIHWFFHVSLRLFFLKAIYNYSN
jgi:hypothetical protein